MNGAIHHATVEGHGATFNVTRGTFANTTFTAGASGVYRIVCHDHLPAMEAQLVVLSRDAWK